MTVKMSLSSDPRAGAFEVVERLLRPPKRRQGLAGFTVALLGPAATTFLASIPSLEGTALPALLYLLSVVAAAVSGGLWPGLAAAAVSFVALDYFFTPPAHTFQVGKSEDLFALGLFLLVAVAVSAVISVARDRQARSEFRERQVRALNAVTSRLLSGSRRDEVLRDLATSIRTLYALHGCRISVVGADGIHQEKAMSGEVDEAVSATIPLVADSRTIGAITMSGPSLGVVLGPEGQVLKTFVGQLALALEGARLSEEAAEARMEAAESGIRAALFSSVTHDLRTPLASITASASSLLEEGVPFTDDQRRELLRTILEESERLNRLVGNLMDLSRLRAGALTPSVEPVALEDLVASVLRRLQPRLEGRPVRVRIREDLPDVPVDVVQMDQVLTNLIENAARYSPPHSEIGVSGVRWHDTVEVRVSDRGPGIPTDERSKVFEEFYRRDVDGHRGGTGLGLSIAHAVVAAHGGAMWVEETPGGGATVGFRLPLAAQGRGFRAEDDEG
jgi:two-component system sensor histidine kinase KdpD